MLIYSRFVLIIIFCFFKSVCFSATGCVVGGAYVYNYPDPNGPFGTPPVPSYLLAGPPSSYGVSTSSYCVRIYGASNSCYVRAISPSTNSPSYGRLADYSALPCPLDDYIWLLFLPLGALTFYYMQKRNIPGLG